MAERRFRSAVLVCKGPRDLRLPVGFGTTSDRAQTEGWQSVLFSLRFLSGWRSGPATRDGDERRRREDAADASMHMHGQTAAPFNGQSVSSPLVGIDGNGVETTAQTENTLLDGTDNFSIGGTSERRLWKSSCSPNKSFSPPEMAKEATTVGMTIKKRRTDAIFTEEVAMMNRKTAPLKDNFAGNAWPG